MCAENGERQGRSDAMGGDEHLERGALVAVQESEQLLRIVTNVVMHVQERGSARLELGECAWRDRHEISDAAHFDEHDGLVGSFEYRAAQRTDHLPAPLAALWATCSWMR